MRFSILLLILLFSFTNCSKDHLFDCTKSTGNEIEESRTIGKFKNIHMDNDVDIILYSDTTDFVRVKSGSHLIDGIITEVDGNTLYIRNENKCNWVRSFGNKYTVTIGMKNPEHIETYGSGNLFCNDTIRTDEFFFDSWNASGSFHFIFNNRIVHLVNNIGRTDIHASGVSAVAYSFINDVGILDASSLTTNLFYIRNSSTGDLRINVQSELTAEIKYNGNIYYSGNPYKIDRTITGNGTLIHQ